MTEKSLLVRACQVLAVACPITFCATESVGLPAISNRQLVELTDIDGLSVSPDGRFLVFRTTRGDILRNSYALRWHSVDLAGGTVRAIGGGGDPIYLDPGSVQPEAPIWADDRSVVVRALVDGAIGLWKADVRGDRMTPLVTRDEDVEDYGVGPDGRSIVYRVGPSRQAIRRAERQEYDSGILVDPSVDLGQNLYRGGSIGGRMATQRLAGHWYERSGLLWREPRQERRYDFSTGEDKAIGLPRPPGPVDAPGARPILQARSDTGDLAEAHWDKGKGRISVALAGGQQLDCPDPRCVSERAAALAWRPRTKDLVVTFMDRERRQSLYLWSVKAGTLTKIAHSDGLLSGRRRHMYPCAVSGEAAFCVAASPASPPRVERVDLGTGERRVLFDPNAELRASYRPRVRYLRWDIGGGRNAAGVLLQPERLADAPSPIYINYYSCEGFLRGGEGDEWPVPALLEAGFAVACINAVPSTGPQDAVENYRDGLSAVRTLVEKLSLEGIVDRTKVAMGGLSFGSEVAFWIASHSDLVAALSVSSPQLEPASYWLSAVPGSKIPDIVRRVWGLGSPDETPSRWHFVSPALNAEKVRAPVLFQMPEMEARRVSQLYARLAQEGTPTELYAFPDEAHIKVQPRHRLAVYERNLDWFRYWLQDHRDSDPQKAEQYRRWDRLRRHGASSSSGIKSASRTERELIR